MYIFHNLQSSHLKQIRAPKNLRGKKKNPKRERERLLESSTYKDKKFTKFVTKYRKIYN